MSTALYLLFLVSGATALVYQVVWIRSLSLVFGGSHLAVTTVLAVFMGGLALGGRLFGARADRHPRPLRLYGALELGVAAFALLFLGLMSLYPHLYVPLARFGEENRPWLSVVRVLFAVAALIGPTTLMGGTLPVLARYATWGAGGGAHRLSFLYGFNTAGAVLGSAAAGFYLLGAVGVRRTLLLAVAANVAVGLSAWFWPARAEEAPEVGGRDGDDARDSDPGLRVPALLVLWGIGISGFCALAYEVLWTRVLSMVTGTTVYAVTAMLTAFLSGIALGSWSYGWVDRRLAGRSTLAGTILGFGVVQIVLGSCALGVTATMRDLPAHASAFQELFSTSGATEFEVRLRAGIVVAFAYMFVPAFFMGVAFPMAAAVRAASRSRVARSVGDVLTVNTIGAILGAAVSGYLLVHLFGVERTLQMATLLNVGLGLAVIASMSRSRVILAAAAAVTVAGLVALGVAPDWGRIWDRHGLAVFSNNVREIFATPETRRGLIENTEVLYFKEGVNETISVVRAKSGEQGVMVNGRTEASTARADVQCQRALGHVPMLLHPDPKSVFVLGLGTGMTLGAASIHPEVERIVLAEIEPMVLGAARTFAEYNHHVLDHPRLHVVFNDGRNYLTTTSETFDVITADPIQPWSSGAAYLYTSEYYRIMAARLKPGGIACQWLPLYEMSVGDVQMVFRTFAEQFAHVVIWKTHYDAEVIGSNAPIVIDEAALARRFEHEGVRRSLAEVEMGTPEDFLSFFIMGTQGARAYGSGGSINTDDNLLLEFSTPKSQGVVTRMGENVAFLARFREDLRGYSVPPSEPADGEPWSLRWTRNLEAGRDYDTCHATELLGRRADSACRDAEARLESLHPGFAPWRFLKAEMAIDVGRTPRGMGSIEALLREPDGNLRPVRLDVVTMRLAPTRAVVVVVDNGTRRSFGDIVVVEPESTIGVALDRRAEGVLVALRAATASGAVTAEQVRTAIASPPR